MNNHEVPYKEGSWESFQKKLPSNVPFYKSKWFLALSVIALVGIAAGTVLFSDSEEKYNLTAIETNAQEKIETLIPRKNSAKSESTAVPSKIEPKTKSTQVKTATSKEKAAEVPQLAKTKKEKTVKKPMESIKTTPKKTLLPLIKLKNEKKEEPIKTATKETKTEVVSADFVLKTSVCEGSKVDLITNSYNSKFTYHWTINEELKLEGNNQSFEAIQLGNNRVNLSIRNMDNVQVAFESAVIDVAGIPSATVEIENEEFSVKNNYQMEASTLSQNSVSWDMGDGTIVNKKEFSYTYQNPNKYPVTVTITNEQGCSLVEKRTINHIGMYKFRKDYGFSPNGDNMNDLFIPLELISIDVRFEMRIYTRNGQLVYLTTSQNTPWNGKMPDGTDAVFGSYVWVVSLTNELGKEEVYKGTVTNISN